MSCNAADKDPGPDVYDPRPQYTAKSVTRAAASNSWDDVRPQYSKSAGRDEFSRHRDTRAVILSPSPRRSRSSSHSGGLPLSSHYDHDVDDDASEQSVFWCSNERELVFDDTEPLVTWQSTLRANLSQSKFSSAATGYTSAESPADYTKRQSGDYTHSNQNTTRRQRQRAKRRHQHSMSDREPHTEAFPRPRPSSFGSTFQSTKVGATKHGVGILSKVQSKLNVPIRPTQSISASKNAGLDASVAPKSSAKSGLSKPQCHANFDATSRPNCNETPTAPKSFSATVHTSQSNLVFRSRRPRQPLVTGTMQSGDVQSVAATHNSKSLSCVT